MYHPTRGIYLMDALLVRGDRPRYTRGAWVDIELHRACVRLRGLLLSVCGQVLSDIEHISTGPGPDGAHKRTTSHFSPRKCWSSLCCVQVE